MLSGDAVVRLAGLDAVALKPAECDVERALDLPVNVVTVDYEGREHVPDVETLAALADGMEVRVTVPVRADGFDPFGDDSLLRALPDAVDHVFVAGNPAYLTAEESERAVSPRFGRTVPATDNPWVGTEGVERAALATGATQFELLSRSTVRDMRALDAAGFDGELAVYAPTVLADDEDEILDAVGGYVARRGAVRRALPADAATDADAEGRARKVLLRAVDDFALTGSVDRVRERVAALRDAGVDHVVGYPARGVDAFVA